MILLLKESMLNNSGQAEIDNRTIAQHLLIYSSGKHKSQNSDAYKNI